MIDLYNSRFIDLLPPNLQNANTAALSYAIDRQHRDFVEYIPIVIILADVMSLDERLCDFLALTMDLQAYDVDFDLDTKRRLIAIAFKSNSKRGTASAVKEVLATIHGGAEVEEWFQYGGDPYYFKVKVDTESIGITEQDYERFIQNINDYKSIRSHLEGITVTMISKSAITLGGVMVAGETTRATQEVPDPEALHIGIAGRAATISGDVLRQFPQVSDGELSQGGAVPAAATVSGDVLHQYPEISGKEMDQGAAVPAGALLSGDVVRHLPEIPERYSLEGAHMPAAAMLTGECVRHQPAISSRLASRFRGTPAAVLVAGDRIVQKMSV